MLGQVEGHERKLVDRKGRVARKLRISVTDRCNFACLFCMPEKDKVHWIPTEDILEFEEIVRVTKVLASLGIQKVRITGGSSSCSSRAIAWRSCSCA